MKFVEQAFFPPALVITLLALAPFLELLPQPCQFTPEGIFTSTLLRLGFPQLVEFAIYFFELFLQSFLCFRQFVPEPIQSFLNSADFARVIITVIAILRTPLARPAAVPRLKSFELVS